MRWIILGLCLIFSGNANAATCTPEKTSKTVLGPQGPVTLSVYKQMPSECAASFHAPPRRR